MKKYLIFLFIFLFLCSCSTNLDTSINKISQKLENANVKIGKITKIDNMYIFEINLKDATIMFTAIDHQIEFTSYHRESPNIYITYLNKSDLFLGDVYENENSYCSYVFLDETSNPKCTNTQITYLKELKENFNTDLESMNIKFDELIEWANWYFKKN